MLNETGGRTVPADAPDSFVPARYADYLAKARKGGDDTAYRHFWELCVVLALRDGLRSGDVYVPGSRRYADPATPKAYRHSRATPCLTGICEAVPVSGHPTRASTGTHPILRNPPLPEQDPEAVLKIIQIPVLLSELVLTHMREPATSEKCL